MATLREIRKRISSIRSTQQITKAMKMVAAAKLRRAQDSTVHIRPYAYELRTMIGHLMTRCGDVTDIQLLRQRPVHRTLVVVVSADRGLCGAFNSNIIRVAARRMAECEQGHAALYLVGRKGLEFFQKRNFPVETHKENFFNHLKFDDALEISRNLISFYTNRQFDRVEFIYNEFKSAIQQRVIVEQFLPFVPDVEMLQESSQVDFLYEPEKKTILNQVIPKHLNVQVWRILLESNAAEQGARMTAMESATDNAQDIIERLTIYYNRSRQSLITKELSEIVGGADALKASQK